MKFILENRTLEFKLIPLNFEKKYIDNIFYRKNNKTLKQTLVHPKYLHLRKIFNAKYNGQLNSKLGDFLKILKENKDSSYLCFLNRYGDFKFCKFKIDLHLEDKGIYCFIEDNVIKYVGRCTDNLKKRINQGYGTIHPKNCFIDGQATNCRVNSILNSSPNVMLGFYLMTNKTTAEIKEMEKMILTSNRFEWNIQTS